MIPALITSARVPKSLDADTRNRRYLISMGVRVVCFIAACFAPFPAMIPLMIGAAVIPAIAVILANNIDLRTPAPESRTPQETLEAPALESSLVVRGDVEDEA